MFEKEDLGSAIMVATEHGPESDKIFRERKWLSNIEAIACFCHSLSNPCMPEATVTAYKLLPTEL